MSGERPSPTPTPLLAVKHRWRWLAIAALRQRRLLLNFGAADTQPLVTPAWSRGRVPVHWQHRRRRP